MTVTTTDLQPETLASIDTPALILDEARMEANIARMRSRVEAHGVPLRPHLKTAKSVEVARRLMATPQGPCTVSTLREAEGFAEAGVTDILYAVSIAPGKLERVLRLRRRGVDLSIIVDDLPQARAVAAASLESGDRIPVLIEIDADGHRGGAPPDDPERIVAVGRALAAGGAALRGVLAHAGSSYACGSEAALRAVAEVERSGATRAAEILRAAGLPCPVVSVGSTPTALFAEDLTGVTEVRAGVFVFFDLVMAGLGVCRQDDIALSVLTTVIGTRPAERQLLIDAGWMALSRDRGTAQQALDQGYGVVCDLDGRPIGDLIVVAANQEHGIVAARSGAGVPDLPVGTRLRILPNHACATAAQHDSYQVVHGARYEIMDRWSRLRGW